MLTNTGGGTRGKAGEGEHVHPKIFSERDIPTQIQKKKNKEKERKIKKSS